MSEREFSKQLRQAETHLRRACPRLRTWIDQIGRCDLAPELNREPYEALVRSVAHQQLHGKAAESILGRLYARFPNFPPTAVQLSRMRVASYRNCGFSLSKTEAIRGIARAQLEGKIPSRAQAQRLSDADLISKLIELRGIGKWTVEMLLIFTLGRLDVMPVDDFGVRMGLKHLYELDVMPKKEIFAERTDAWSPYRSIGAWYLWRLADARKTLSKA